MYEEDMAVGMLLQLHRAQFCCWAVALGHPRDMLVFFKTYNLCFTQKSSSSQKEGFSGPVALTASLSWPCNGSPPCSHSTDQTRPLLAAGAGFAGENLTTCLSIMSGLWGRNMLLRCGERSPVPTAGGLEKEPRSSEQHHMCHAR